MGQALIRALLEAQRTGTGALRLSGALASAHSGQLGRDAALVGTPAGVLVTSDPVLALRGATVAVDFSVPEGVSSNAAACAAAGVPLLVGTTGYDARAREALIAASLEVAVLLAPNTSIGVSVLLRLAALAGAALDEDYDVEIAEAHHRMKRDAPSGTALALGEAVAHSRGRELSDVATFDRQGVGTPRVPGSIGFSVLRAGDIVGEHTVVFAGSGERIEITHRASDRMTFARGALRASTWLLSQPPGLYSMRNVVER